jgi:hypothetical protein
MINAGSNSTHLFFIMDKSEKFAEALKIDYANLSIFDKIEKSKSNEWQNPEAFWQKILTNQMHIGSNGNTLRKRMNTDEFKAASNFKKFAAIDKKHQKELLDKFVPGGHYAKKDTKIQRLLFAIDYISSNNVNSLFGAKLPKESIIFNLKQLDGLGDKQARNIPMDLYHPAFRNGTIPIDENWKKISKYLGFKWSNSEKHENEIIKWREKYISRDIIKDDWDFDRLVYFALNDPDSQIRKLIKG